MTATSQSSFPRNRETRQPLDSRESGRRCGQQQDTNVEVRKGKIQMDPRTVTLGTDRWLTDSRVYNLVWLGRWIERAETVARVLKWAAEQEGGDLGTSPGLDEVARMAASVRGVSLEPGDSALDALLTQRQWFFTTGLSDSRQVQRDPRCPGRGDQEHRQRHKYT